MNGENIARKLRANVDPICVVPGLAAFRYHVANVLEVIGYVRPTVDRHRLFQLVYREVCDDIGANRRVRSSIDDV